MDVKNWDENSNILHPPKPIYYFIKSMHLYLVENFAWGALKSRPTQGCQLVYFHTKNPNLGIFWRALEWNLLVYVFYDHWEYFASIWNILWPFGVVCGHLLSFFSFGCLDQEKSGNPGPTIKMGYAVVCSWKIDWESNPTEEVKSIKPEELGHNKTTLNSYVRDLLRNGTTQEWGCVKI
jgi:hypothetical protein